MKKVLIVILMMLSCETANNKGKFIEDNPNLTYLSDAGIITIDNDFQMNVDKSYVLKKEKENTFYFSKDETESSYLHLKLSDLDEAEFSSNLTRLSQTYEHLLDEYTIISDNIDRIKGQRGYQLVFAFKDKESKERLNIIQCIQVNDKQLLTITSSTMTHNKDENYQFVGSLINSIKVPDKKEL